MTICNAIGKNTRQVLRMAEQEAYERRRRDHNVYVVELCSLVRGHPVFRQHNPHIGVNGRCFYVGMTGLTPEERFRNHKSGRLGSYFVEVFGMGLVPDLYTPINPLPWMRARDYEILLAEALSADGHGVIQG